MDFLDSTGSSAATANAQRLGAGGMPPANDPQGSVGTDGTDHATLKAVIGQPFDLAEVSTIFLEFMLAYRQAARMDRQSSLQGQMNELLSSAAKTREAADAEFNKALVQGIASAVGGLIQGAIGAAQFKTLGAMKTNLAQRSGAGTEPNPRFATRLPDKLDLNLEGASKAASRTASKSAPDLLDQMKAIEKGSPSLSVSDNRKSVNLDLKDKNLTDQFQMLSSKSQALSMSGQAGKGLIVDAPSTLVASLYEKEAGYSRAQGQEHEAQAKKAEAAFASATDEAQTARDAFNKVLDMVAEVERSRSETSKSIARI
jgi:hypothetical protein